MQAFQEREGRKLVRQDADLGVLFVFFAACAVGHAHTALS